MIQQLQKPGVQMGLLAVVVMIAGGAFFLTKRAAPPVNSPPVVENKKGEVVAPETLKLEDKKVTLGEDRTARIGSDQQVERFVVPTQKPPPPSLISTGNTNKNKEQGPPPYPKLVHVSSPPVSQPFQPAAPTFFAPRGMLIKAALVITVDSSSLETPVLALITEDIYWNRRLIIPAGTQVLAQAAQGRTRDRIEVKGNYTFIWADGREYNISCVALDHERLTDGTYALTDGSAGIRGQIVKNDQYAELKILVAEALEGIMNNNKSQFQSIYGLAPQNTTNNAALGGGAQAASAYSGLLTKKLEQDLDFVRVPAGTQFYIFTKDVFEPDLASVAGLRQGGKAATSWQLAEETYARAQAQAADATEKGAQVAEATRKAEEQKRTAERAARVSGLINPGADSSPSVTPTSSTTP